MANRSYLVARNSAGFSATYSSGEILLGASYVLPLFWLSLFSSADIKSMKLGKESEEGAEDLMYYLDEEGLKEGIFKGWPDHFPTLFVDHKTALKRVRERRDMFFDKISFKFDLLYDWWITFIEKVEAPFLQVDLHEIWAMHKVDFQKFDDNLRQALEIFEPSSGQAGWEIVFDYFLEIPWDSEVRKYGLGRANESFVNALCGHGWEKKSPWDDTDLF